MARTAKCPPPEPVCNNIKPLLPCPKRGITLDFSDHPSLTRQEFKAECDINNIMRKYFRTGMLTHVNKYEGQYGDCPAVDFQEALNIVQRGGEMFAELPAKVRARFENDPAQFLAFVDDEDNREEAVLLGLIEAPTEPPEPPAEPPVEPAQGGDD